jgi:hypothetical protein
MVEQRVVALENDVTDLRIDQASVKAKLDTALGAIGELTVAVDHLTAAMNRAAGERMGAKAAYAAIGSIVGALGAMIVEWFAQHR